MISIKRMNSFSVADAIKIACIVSAWVMLYFLRSYLHHSPQYLVLIAIPGVFVISLYAPGILWPIEMLLSSVFKVISATITYAVLIFIFYFIFTPLAFIFKCSGRDVLFLKCNNEITSLWKVRKQQVIEPDFFKQQF